MKIAIKLIVYCLLFGLLVSICSYLFFLLTSKNPHIVKNKLEISMTYGMFMIIMGGELIVLALLAYAYLAKRIKYLYNAGLNINLLYYTILIILILCSIIKFRRFQYYSTALDWIRGIHLNGWFEVITPVLGVLIYYRELRPIFVKEKEIVFNE